MTYKETLDWMFAQLPMYQSQGKSALNAKLNKIIAFSEHLGNLHKNFKSIHVAGTNGKGSSSHMLASILQEAGYKVGLYTSPHLKDFRERIRINGKTVSKQFVVDFIHENNSFIEEYTPSFFEMTVAMAFANFSEEKVDIAIIEVGLGGRFDSTNIITPEVSLITNIGLDHTDILGDTLEKIAFEKAGIIKKNIPIIVSERQEETTAVFTKIAQEKSAKLVFASDDNYPSFETTLFGNYQEKNIKGVQAVLKHLNDFVIEEKHIEAGFAKVVENTGLLGRWQILSKHPKTVCDTAHNKEGLILVLNQITKEEFKHLHIVLGFVKDKDLESVLPLFPTEATYYFCKPAIQRGLEAKSLQKKALKYSLTGKSYDSVKKAQQAANQASLKDDFIFIGGSNFVVAEVV